MKKVICLFVLLSIFTLNAKEFDLKKYFGFTMGDSKDAITKQLDSDKITYEVTTDKDDGTVSYFLINPKYKFLDCELKYIILNFDKNNILYLLGITFQDKNLAAGKIIELDTDADYFYYHTNCDKDTRELELIYFYNNLYFSFLSETKSLYLIKYKKPQK